EKAQNVANRLTRHILPGRYLRTHIPAMEKERAQERGGGGRTAPGRGESPERGREGGGPAAGGGIPRHPKPGDIPGRRRDIQEPRRPEPSNDTPGNQTGGALDVLFFPPKV